MDRDDLNLGRGTRVAEGGGGTRDTDIALLCFGHDIPGLTALEILVWHRGDAVLWSRSAGLWRARPWLNWLK